VEGNRQVELSSRPIRFAFILGADPTEKEILNVIKHCCETHGGAHNIIIPSNGESFDDWWGRFLVASDPDVVIYRGKFNNIRAIKSQIAQLSIQPFNIKAWHGESATSTAKYSPLSVDRIYRAKAAEAAHYGHGKKYNVVTVKRRGRNFTLFDYFNYGILSRSFRMKYGEILNFVNPFKTRADIADDADIVDDTVELTRENIKHGELEYYYACFDDSVTGPYVVVTGDKNSLQDCCLFWNWKALSSKWLYVGWIDKTDINRYFQQPTDFLQPEVANLPIDAKLFTSVTLGPSTSEPVKELLSLIPDYSQKVSNMGFYYKHPSEYDRGFASTIYFTEKESLSLSNENYLRISRRTPPPYNYEDCLFKSLVIDLEIKSQFTQDKRGVRVSPHHKVEDVWTVETQPREVDIRVSRSCFTILLPWTLSTGTVNIKLNSDWEIITNVFSRKGLIVDESPSGKHIRRSLELLGGIDELASQYKNKVTRAMLNAFQIPHSEIAKSLEGRRREVYRRSYTVQDLMKEVLRSLNGSSAHHKRKISANVDLWFSNWLKNGVLVSGFQLDCPECDFTSWYPIEAVGEKYVCTRCRSENRRPHQSEIHYRLHESVYQAHIENMVVPVLTLDFLKTDIAQDSFIYSVPVSIEKGNPRSPDIDIIAIVDGDLFIGECKNPNKLDNEVFNRYDQLVEKVMPDCIVFSTIKRDNACKKRDCRECSSGVIGQFYSDETFTHGVSSNTEQWGTREKIRDFREKLNTKGISVYTLCAYTLGFEDQSSSKK